ncbi:MAG: FAD-dependent oxidoreductase [Egibacteraceae bacterium]
MFADARSVATQTRVDTDLCIVGGGAAGITLAREFIGSPLRVTVLESGDFEYDDQTQALYDGRSVGLPYSPLNVPRLRYFGGTTNHWGGICRPWEDADFEARQGIRFTGWPVRKADLAPFYAPAARVCRVPSKEWALDEWVRRDQVRPLALNTDRIVTRVTQIVPRSSRSFGKNYRSELRQARNVTVYLHANVTNVETDQVGTTATSVRVATLSGSRFSVGARVFVLATGALENPRLLLVSNERWSKGLGNQNDLVGRFFMDHARFIGGVIAPSNPYASMRFYELHPVGNAILRGYLATSKEFQLTEGLLDVQIRPEPVYEKNVHDTIKSSSVSSLKRMLRSIRRGEEVPDFGRHVTNVMADLATWQKFTIPAAPVPVPYPEVLGEVMGSTRREAEQLIPTLVGDVAARAYLEYFGAAIDSILLSTRIEQAPNPDSRVMLTEDRDQLGMQRVALDWRMSDIDRRNARRSLELLGAEIGRAGIGRLKILLAEGDSRWPDDLNGGQHLMGTTRMSDDPKQGVVDRNCRVHEMANLFVAGSSVFPTAGGGTPTLTLVALALRLAEHLKRMMRS